MKVVILPAARNDIDEIGGYVARDDPAAAERLLELLRSGCAGLASAPRQGKIIGRSRGRDVRRLAIDGYLVIFTIDGDTVNVRRIRHGARSPKTLLRGLEQDS